MLSTELGVAEREGRYGFRRARRGPSVGHALFGRVNSAECSCAQPTPTRPLPSLLHTAIYHPLADYQEFRDRFPKRHLSLSLHPASFASVAQSARRRPPSALSSSAASSASSSRSALPGFFCRPPITLLYSARPPGWAASSRPHSNRTARTARVGERLCMMVRKAPIQHPVSSTSSLYTTRVFRHATHSPSHLSHVPTQS